MNKVVLILLAIFLPPVAVFLKSNELGKDLLINIALCLLFFVPGMVHALWYVTK